MKAMLVLQKHLHSTVDMLMLMHTCTWLFMHKHVCMLLHLHMQVQKYIMCTDT